MDGQFPPGYMSYGQQGQQQGQQQQPSSQPGQQPPQQQQQSQHPPAQQSGLGSTFGSLSATPSHSQQDSPASGHPTLPPLQSQNGGYAQFGSLSYAHPGSQTHTPPTPHTPVTSSMGNGSGQTSAYSHVSPASAMGPPSYSQNPYGMSSSMMYPSSTSTSMPPSTSSAGGLPTIRPMPPGGVGGPMGGLPSLGNPQMGHQPSFMQNEEAPTHVVGSQGRRGILPSAPGRPNAPVSGSGQTGKNMIPQKDADGKYPCPHCNKTYLHAKHLKRHLLRHTGDRPYSCHLCKDTFSRSDILKRHFQKCSIRRGNPTGANHLAHQRRNTNTGNRLSISQQDGPIGLAGLSEVAGGSNPYNPGVVSSSPTVNGDISGRSSRANSLIAPNGMSHRNSIAGLGILGSNAPGGEQQMGSSQAYQPNLHAYALQNSSNGSQMPPGYPFNQQHMNGGMFNNQQQQQPMSFLGQQSSRFDTSHNSPHQQTPNGEAGGAQMDWSRMFNQSGQDGFIGGSLPANASSQGMNNIKSEPDTKPFNDPSNDSFLGSLYSHPGAFGCEETENEHGIPGFPNWSMDDPLQAKVDSLMQYCFPDGGEPARSDPDAAEMVKMCLSVENVKHFAEHYTSYHGHWPIIHMPTFKLTDAGNSLVLAIITIGAIYSPRMNVSQSRQMMEFVRATVLKNSTIWQQVTSGQNQEIGNNSWEVDDLQALLIISTMFTWHGSPEQRDVACSDLPVLVRVARAMGLLHSAAPGHYAYSVLHHSQSGTLSQEEWSSWSWHGWLEQEKRSRAAYLLFLCDAAMCMYFNNTPQLDPLEIRLPLPADDAAWDAKNADECANALGLNGPEAQSKNITGTRNARQPSMRDATRTLLELNGNFQPGATNVYSKFVLIHALITRIMACQKVLFVPEGSFQGFNNPFGGSGPATPLSQNEWLDQHGNGSLSNGNSGAATPTDGYNTGAQNGQAQHEKKRLNAALDKWKRMWDTDVELQYPPSKTQLRRFGFSRDGVHFFYLGRSFIQSNRPGDWTAAPDVRFKQVMGLLKRIKQFVVGDPSHYGHEIGSVGDIDDQYGLDNLTLDMKLLFKPYNSQVHSAVAGVQTSVL